MRSRSLWQSIILFFRVRQLADVNSPSVDELRSALLPLASMPVHIGETDANVIFRRRLGTEDHVITTGDIRLAKRLVHAPGLASEFERAREVREATK